MIDVRNSGFKNYYFWEHEVSAMGGIRWDQIEAWIPAPLDAWDNGKPSAVCRKFTTKKNFPRSWIRNVEYNNKYDHFTGSGGQPQLSGSTENVKKHTKSLEEYGLEFMKKSGEAVGWNPKKFPFLELKVPEGEWKGPAPLDSWELALKPPADGKPVCNVTEEKIYDSKSSLDKSP
ncbi:hypothetical protein CDD80_849 [Ophiocordyceps camponoti-rufipedis]|uniref:Uncharacterized protein n=1 Tax=Ophiocordyceps camponoti-rufipedis TaxID=2004952 RepID=A0A2C5ZLB7_9HYPO|nr:hypothetical protein CDD80_849 [Ophiocordyceps camponoti-rufipedis]